jgi:hypothetical protein
MPPFHPNKAAKPARTNVAGFYDGYDLVDLLLKMVLRNREST